MNYRELNSARDIQVLLKEAHLYPGTIDGKWGPGTGGGLTSLFSSFFTQIGGGAKKPLPIHTRGGEGSIVEGIKSIQRNLVVAGLYNFAVDGLAGSRTMDGLKRVKLAYVIQQSIPTYGLAWSKLVPPEFAKRVDEWTRMKGYWEKAADCLMSCMHFESGGTFSPSKQNNGGSNYWGLAQFGTMAATDLGVSLEVIKRMTQMEQLELVFKYFEMWERRGKRYNALEDFYLTIFYPSAVGKRPEEALFRKNSERRIEVLSYLQNNGFDYNKDGIITVGEITTKLYSTYYTGMVPNNRAIV